MTRESKIDPPDVVIARFEQASSQMTLWNQEFQDAYRFVAPNRSDLVENTSLSATQGSTFTRGESRAREIFDTTAVESVLEFANNMQMTLMPSFQRWASITTIDDIQNLPESFSGFGSIDQSVVDEVNKQLEDNMDLLFRYLDSSNFAQAANESFQDLAIGTGALMWNMQPNDFKNPISFTSVSLSSIVVEEGPNKTIENVWRPLKEKGRNILSLWPKADISPELQKTINDSPDEFIELLEATIFYPENKRGEQYHYSVSLMGKKTNIISEFRSISPWIIFRFSKSPNETLGRGPVLTMLPTIRQLNQLVKFGITGAKFNAYPAYTAISSTDFNPYMINIEPGAIIPISPEFAGQDVIRPIPQAGSPEFQQQTIQLMQQAIKDALFANPLPPVNGPNKTATEISIRQEGFIQKNGGTFARLGVELMPKVIDTFSHVLTTLGIMEKIKINKAEIPMDSDSRVLKFEFVSPLADIQKKQDAQVIEQAVQFAQSAFGGPEGMLTFNITEMVRQFYDEIKLPSKLVNPNLASVVGSVQQALESQLQQSTQQQQQQPQDGDPSAANPTIGSTAPTAAAGPSVPQLQLG